MTQPHRSRHADAEQGHQRGPNKANHHPKEYEKANSRRVPRGESQQIPADLHASVMGPFKSFNPATHHVRHSSKTLVVRGKLSCDQTVLFSTKSFETYSLSLLFDLSVVHLQCDNFCRILFSAYIYTYILTYIHTYIHTHRQC